MNKIKMNWLPPKNSHISQIYSSGLEFAFSTETDQCTDFIYCKDFLQDCVYANLNKKPISIYGFKYNPKERPIDLTKARILVANASDTKINEKVDGCEDFLNQIEKKLKIFRTKISLCDPPHPTHGKVYSFRGSGIWLNSPPMLSLYSLFIRIGFCHKKGEDFMVTMDSVQKGTVKPYQRNDASYLSQSRQAIDAIFKLGYRKFFYKNTEKNYPGTIDINTMHNSCGIVAFMGLLKNTTPINGIPKYWNRKSVLKQIGS